MQLCCDPGLRMAVGEPDPTLMPTEDGGTTEHLLLDALFTARHNQLKQKLEPEKRINKGKRSSIHMTGKIQFQLHKFQGMRH